MGKFFRKCRPKPIFRSSVHQQPEMGYAHKKNGDDSKSKFRLFADDSLLYMATYCNGDCNQLQKDLDKLVD